jgi:uncharacterized heparinase superfamily protein
MTISTKDLIEWLEAESKVAKEEDAPVAEAILRDSAQRLRVIDKLVKAVHSAKGRHHSQIAMCDLYEACGLPFQRPNFGSAVKSGGLANE